MLIVAPIFFVSPGVKKGANSFFFAKQIPPFPAVVVVVVAAVAASKGVYLKKKLKEKN